MLFVVIIIVAWMGIVVVIIVVLNGIIVVGRRFAAMHGEPRIHRNHWIGCIQCPHKYASPLSIRSWFKGGAAHCGYSWREKLRQPQRLTVLEAVCSPECPEFDSEGCQRALSLLYSGIESSFLTAH